MRSEDVLKGVMVAGLVTLGVAGLVLGGPPVAAAVVGGGKAVKTVVIMGVGMAAGVWLATRK